MNFFENLNEDTLNKLKQEKSEFENLIKSNIRIKSNKGGLKVYQLNSIQTIKFKKISIIDNKEKNYKNEIKNEKKDSKNLSDYNNILNMQQLMFQQQQQQMLIQQMLFQQHQMNVNHGEINVIFRTSGSNNGCKIETVMISCKLTEKTSDIINRYREKSKNYKKN